MPSHRKTSQACQGAFEAVIPLNRKTLVRRQNRQKGRLNKFLKKVQILLVKKVSLVVLIVH
jgi:hypothetical protein